MSDPLESLTDALLDEYGDTVVEAAKVMKYDVKALIREDAKAVIERLWDDGFQLIERHSDE